MDDNQNDLVRSVVRRIDHALLHPTLGPQAIRRGCELARDLGAATACVAPWAVPLASEILAGSATGVGTVIGFPHGTSATSTKAAEARTACLAGARELDMVAAIGRAIEGDWKEVEADIGAVVEVAREFGALVKVIFETDYLTGNDAADGDPLKIGLCQASEAAGADFVKTSTGFGFVKQADGHFRTVGATLADIRLMRKHVGPKVQVKASGGIRTLADCLALIEAGASRLGTSNTAPIAAEIAAEIAGTSDSKPGSKFGSKPTGSY